MIKYSLPILGALVGLAFTPAAIACDATLVIPRSTVDLRTAPTFDNVSSRERFDVVVRNDGDTNCRIELAVGVDPAFAGPFPSYSITGPGGVAQFDAQTPASQGGAGVITTILEVDAGSEVNIGYDVAARVGWELAADTYLRRILFSLSTLDNAVIVDEGFVDLAVEVPLSSRLDFVGNVDRLSLGRVKFGEETVSPPFGMRVFATSSYTIDIESENSGQLIRDEGDAFLSYSMRLNGQLLELAPVDTVTSGSRSQLLGDTYSIVASVRAETDQRAGRYSDRVTITVTPF